MLRDHIGKITVLSAKENEWQMSMFDKTQYIIEQKLVAIWDTYGAKDVNGNLLGYAVAMDHLEQKSSGTSRKW